MGYYDPNDFNQVIYHSRSADYNTRLQMILDDADRLIDETRVLKCPAGNVPKSASYIRQSGTCTASFERNICENCPLKDQCKPQFFKRVAKVRVTGKQVRRVRQMQWMKSEEFKLFARLRNGVETIPSILKNTYGVNRMNVRGLLRCKLFFGSKVAALNFRKLFRYRKGQGNYAQNPLLAKS